MLLLSTTIVILIKLTGIEKGQVFSTGELGRDSVMELKDGHTFQ